MSVSLFVALLIGIVLAVALWSLLNFASAFLSCWRCELHLREVEEARRAHRRRR